MVKIKKAQASVEFLSILAAAIVIIVIIAILAQKQINTVQNQKDSLDTQNSLLDLSAAAKEVYAQGEGSKKRVFVQLPSSYESNYSFVGNKSIRIRTAGTDHVSLENFNVRGYLPTTHGGQWIWVVSEGNRVRIGNAMLELNPNNIYVVMNSNTTASKSVSITNSWSRNLTVNINITWTTLDVTMSGVPGSFQLSVNSSLIMDVQFDAGPTSGGVYTGRIDLQANDGQGNMETTSIPITVQVIPPNQITPETDVLGPIITNIYQNPLPAVKLISLSLYVDASDALTGNNFIGACEIDADNANNWQDMLPLDGAYDEINESLLFNYTSGFVLGPHTIRARCLDVLNNTGPTAYYYFNISEADQLGPIVIEMHHSEYPTTLSNISVGGIATDEYTGNSNVQLCKVKLDSGSWISTNPDDGSWGSASENFSYNFGPLPVGYHTVYHQCTDSLGNAGGVYNDSFGIIDVDLIIVLDRSGSMLANVTNSVNSNTVSASSTGWSYVKTLTVSEKNGDMANLSVELRASTTGCTAFYNATIGGVQVATGNRTSTSYGTILQSINVSSYEPPYNIVLWLKRNLGGCTAYNRAMSLQQPPSKMNAAKNASKSFIDIAGNSIQAGLVSFSSSASTNRLLALMTPENQVILKNSIDALIPSGSTCIECGLIYAANELVSVRGRPAATRVVVFLTDGQGNVGDSINGAVYCRDRNVTVYTIGFGSDVDDVELTNVALLTHGEYYFAPNAETLNAIFQNIGR